MMPLLSIPGFALGSVVHAGLGVGLESILHPFRSDIAARYQWDDLAKRYKAWEKSPFVIPEPGDLLDALVRFPETKRGPLLRGLLRHGITLDDKHKEPGRGRITDTHFQAHLWRTVAASHRTVPGPGVWAELWQRGWPLARPVDDLILRAGGSPSFWKSAARLSLARPSPEAWWEGAVRGLLDREDDPDGRIDAEYYIKRAGGDFQDYLESLRLAKQMPSIGEAIEGFRRGKVDDTLWKRILKFHLQDSSNLQPMWEEFKKGIPGVTDLNMFGIRHSWQPELVERYGYYLEFPERLREWYAKLGLNYPVGFQARTDQGVRDITMADAYWSSHWHVMPLNQAFMAYQRFQPDLVRRFQADNPNLTPFVREDLNVHMRQADFPPGVRDWLEALAHPVLGRRDVNWGAQFLGWDRAEMQARYRILGYTTDDAAALARIAENRESYRQNAWARSLGDSVRKRTIKMIEGLYEDGTVDKPFAMRQLSATGLSGDVSAQLLDIVDFGVERTLVRQAIRATGRDYLSGVLSRGDAEIQLGRIGVTGSRIQNYLHAWGIQRDARRKRLETGKIQAMVAEGLLSGPEARARLVNLQWSDPDATLLLAEAAGKLSKRVAQEEKARESEIRRRARELERLAKDADAQSRKLRAEANRVAPRSVLMRWVKEGEIGEDSFRSMMRERGYPEGDIDLYWQETQRPTPRPPRPAPTAPPWPKPKGSAHPAQARLALWLADGIITLDQYAQGLRDLGYSDDDTAKFVADARPEASNGAAG